jgi:dihydroneopterin aldolase
MIQAAGTGPAEGAAFGGAGSYRMFVRDLVLPCRIGVHPHERETAQRVRVNVDLAVEDVCAATGDDIAAVVSYEDVVFGVRAIAAQGHINLVETMAESVAGLCLADPRVRVARVRVEKLDVFPEADSVGVEIERVRKAP